MKNIIKSVDPDSPLHGKTKAGDMLVSINGNPIQDVLDYKFYAYDPSLKIEFTDCDGRPYHVIIKHPAGMELGLDFETYLMDRPRSCANNCVFCFVDQLPPGMRKTMYFKDDDARLSFLLGNYITLTNLSEREIRRIMDLHVSPINISVHTTDKALRIRMLNNPRAGESIEVMHRFADAGITMNCQIVCCPGLNDGDALMNTMHDLEEMYPSLHSVSIVPVGLTKYRQGLYPLTPFTREHAGETIDLVEDYAQKCFEKHGTRIFFCSDELYIQAERELPEDEYYEEHTQLENGVGMIRLFETEFLNAAKLYPPERSASVSMATGTAFAPYLQNMVCRACSKYDKIKVKVFPIENRFFGPSITVSGLITGRDLIDALKGKDLGDRLIITRNMIRRDELDFLDDVTLKHASEELGVPIIATAQDGFASWDAITGEQNDQNVISDKIGRTGEETEYYRYNQNE